VLIVLERRLLRYEGMSVVWQICGICPPAPTTISLDQSLAQLRKADSICPSAQWLRNFVHSLV
jgi:hypothetical protein